MSDRYPINARVRVVGGPWSGRVGPVTRVPRTFADVMRYVHLDPKPRERTKKVECIMLEHLVAEDT